MGGGGGVPFPPECVAQLGYGALESNPELLLFSSCTAPPPAPVQPGIDPSCVESVIMAAAEGLGVDLSGFEVTGVQIAGQPNPEGGKYKMTELFLSGGNVQALEDQLCMLGWANNHQCEGGAGNSILVGVPHKGSSGNFRAPGLFNSMQINTGPDGIQLDIDPFNPAAGKGFGAFLHIFGQVIPNLISGKDNTYGCN